MWKGDWHDILRRGRRNEINWAKGMEDILEMDLFDSSPSNVKMVIDQVMGDTKSTNPYVVRLEFLASTRTLLSIGITHASQWLLTSYTSSR